jgi:sulfur relay (sulfurtransferase) DsrF/TusC family protein
MKTMHILALGIVALALALASGSAEALFVLKIEDPALDGGVFQVVDNQQPEDINPLDDIITTAIDENGVSTIINAISSEDKTLPRLVLDLVGYQSHSD